MSHRKAFVLPLVASLMGLGAARANAGVGTIASNLGGPGYNIAIGSPSALGQSFSTPAGSWDNISFNFFSDAASTTPEATGNLWLLSSPYFGSPAGLNSSIPGFMAEATSIVGGQHVFNSSVRLNGNSQYFVYEDALENSNASYIDFAGGGGQSWYSTTGLTTPYSASGSLEQNFAVQGTPFTGGPITPAPEPAMIGLLGFGGLALVGRRRRRA